MAAGASRLREVLAGDRCLAGAGAFDGLSARIVEAAGLGFVHASGGAIARSIGHPDTGVVTMTEMLVRLCEISAAVALPILADADTGYGNKDNAARAALEFRRAGAAGVHVEDQTFPKRCGHMAGVTLVPADAMCAKIAAMRAAVGDGLVIVARTDAVGIEGMDSALARMRRYLAAGAEAAFVEGLRDAADLRAATAHGAPAVVNLPMASTGLPLSLDELGTLGYRLAVFPGDLQRAAILAMEATARAIAQQGDTRSVAGLLATQARRDALVAPRPAP